MNTSKQKASGAYFTRTDVAEYLAQATIVPWVLDAVAAQYPAWLGPGGTGWQGLRADPDRYMPPALRYGGRKPLPTETPLERIARRRRYREVRALLVSGAVTTSDDLVTLNLDLRRLVHDLVQGCGQEDWLAGLQQALQRIRVLDPTCGDGAFLTAALAILEDLSLACLQRLHPLLPNRCEVRRTILEQNLFGVDICSATVRACRRRLLDQLVAARNGNNGTLSKPDLTTQIRRGNVVMDDTLPAGGFDVVLGNPPYLPAQQAGYRNPRLATADCPDVYAWILERSAQLLRPGGRCGMIVPLSLGFSSAFDVCRRFLFATYRTNWFASFGRIPSALFDYDIRVRNTIHIGHKEANWKPLAPASGERGWGDGESLLLVNRLPHPHPLSPEVGERGVLEKPTQNFTTRLHRWFDEARPQLFDLLHYVPFQPARWDYRIPKLNQSRLGRELEACLQRTSVRLADSLVPGPTPFALHFKKTAYNWLTFCRRLPPCYNAAGRPVAQTQFATVYFAEGWQRDAAMLFLNGQWAFAFWCVVGDDFHVARWMFGCFPLDLARLPASMRRQLPPLARCLEQAMQRATTFKRNAGKRVGTYNLARCRQITDRSDALFGKFLGLETVWPDVQLLCAQIIKTDWAER